ncbi:hypothetical protein PoB_002939200 [Plakobranchus ocellatus]|uniref:Uncharacterized protein n=1 Tax=Plakobranchus ocellatus TaxID=259542 RepID=A0AAV4A6J1_9GAST|nr:hypothetical protein PoB_002939200 [Plakobranchus ocellatus]
MLLGGSGLRIVPKTTPADTWQGRNNRPVFPACLLHGVHLMNISMSKCQQNWSHLFGLRTTAQLLRERLILHRLGEKSCRKIIQLSLCDTYTGKQTFSLHSWQPPSMQATLLNKPFFSQSMASQASTLLLSL